MTLPPDHTCDLNCDHEDEDHKRFHKRLRNNKLAQCHQVADQAWATFRDKETVLTTARDRMINDPSSLTEADLEAAIAALNLVLGEIALRRAIATMGWD